MTCSSLPFSEIAYPVVGPSYLWFLIQPEPTFQLSEPYGANLGNLCRFWYPTLAGSLSMTWTDYINISDTTPAWRLKSRKQRHSAIVVHRRQIGNRHPRFTWYWISKVQSELIPSASTTAVNDPLQMFFSFPEIQTLWYMQELSLKSNRSP